MNAATIIDLILQRIMRLREFKELSQDTTGWNMGLNQCTSESPSHHNNLSWWEKASEELCPGLF